MKHLLKLIFLYVVLFIGNADFAFSQIEKIHVIDTTNDDYGGIFVTPQYTYFAGSNRDSPRTLWRTDGTTAGTIQLSQTPNGEVRVDASTFASCLYDSLHNLFYFKGWSKKSGWELWSTDGTETGTRLVKDLTPIITNNKDEYASTNIYSMWLENEYLFILHRGSGSYNQSFSLLFSRLNIQNNELDTLYSMPYSTQTKLGIQRLRHGSILQTGDTLYFLDKNNRINDSLTLNFRYSFTTSLSNEGVLYLSLYDTAASRYYVWSSDGTRLGTTRLFASPSIMNLLHMTSDHVYFLSSTSSYDDVYFCVYNRSSGSIDTVYRATELDDQSTYSFGIAVIGEHILVAIPSRQYGREIWSWNSVSNEVELLKDINPLPFASSIQEYYYSAKAITHNNHVYFFADDGEHGNELWETDGTTAGTRLVQDLNPGGRWMRQIYRSGDSKQCYFITWNGKNERALYRFIYPTTPSDIAHLDEKLPTTYRAQYNNGLLTINSNSQLIRHSELRITVYSSLGSQLPISTVSSGVSTSTYLINQPLACGVYFARLSNGNEICTIPFITPLP